MNTLLWEAFEAIPADVKREFEISYLLAARLDAALKEKGYSTYRIRKEKIFAEATLQLFRQGVIASQSTLEKLCELLDCQPGDILIYEKDTDNS